MYKSYKLSTNETLFVALVVGVKNIETLKKKVISQEIKCGLVTPALILDPFQIAISADKAALAKSRSKLVTKNLYSEILYNLSTSKNISKSLTKFGAQENDKELILVIIGDESDLNKALSQVEGKSEDIGKIRELADHKIIEKEYNIKCPEQDISSLLNSVITRIAVKSML